MYVYVILLLILIFILLKDKKIKSIEEIKEEIDSINEKINDVITNSYICNIQDINDISKIKSLNVEYIILKNKHIKLDNLNTLVANYISQDYKMCGFNFNYKLSGNIFKKAYIAGINYLLLFQKNNIESYGAIILKKEEIEKCNKKLISFVADEILVYEENVDEMKNLYTKSLKYMDLNMIIKSLLLIVIGSMVTANLIYTFISIDYTNYMNFITALVIYYCYAYILNYIYKPVGRYKMFVKYIFPIYILLFILITFLDNVIMVRSKWRK